MQLPTNIKYAKSHEWIRVDGQQAFVGITDHAQSELGDIVFVEVNTVGENLEQGASFGTIEAVKTVSDVYMPVSGKVLEVNQLLESQPEIINKSPYEEGWMIKIEIADPSQLESLLSASEYKNSIATH